MTVSAEVRELKNDKAHAHRHKDIEDIKPSSERVTTPEGLSPRGKEIFEDIVAHIEEMYPCSKSDVFALTLYAQNQEQLEHLENYLRTKGCTYTKETSFAVMEVPRPEVQIHKECKAFALKMLAQFGLTPASRKQVKIEKKQTKQDSPFAVFGAPKLVKKG